MSYSDLERLTTFMAGPNTIDVRATVRGLVTRCLVERIAWGEHDERFKITHEGARQAGVARREYMQRITSKGRKGT